jgi:hypothetical protein
VSLSKTSRERKRKEEDLKKERKQTNFVRTKVSTHVERKQSDMGLFAEKLGVHQKFKTGTNSSLLPYLHLI